MANETDNVWYDVIEWWQTEDGEFNWHALNDENHEVIFGSTQGYASKSYLLQQLSTHFPHVEIRPRDGEPQSSVEDQQETMRAEGRLE